MFTESLEIQKAYNGMYENHYVCEDFNGFLNKISSAIKHIFRSTTKGNPMGNLQNAQADENPSQSSSKIELNDTQSSSADIKTKNQSPNATSQHGSNSHAEQKSLHKIDNSVIFKLINKFNTTANSIDKNALMKYFSGGFEFYKYGTSENDSIDAVCSIRKNNRGLRDCGIFLLVPIVDGGDAMLAKTALSFFSSYPLLWFDGSTGMSDSAKDYLSKKTTTVKTDGGKTIFIRHNGSSGAINNETIKAISSFIY